MADEDQRDAPSAEGGVFGKLPSTRPGMRSPRRGAESAKAPPAGAPTGPGDEPGQVGEQAPESATERRDPATGSPRVRPPNATGHSSPSSPPTRPETAPEPDAPHAGESPGVEDLAWAGITVAAEAATLGVRLLSRAVEALRKPADPG
jgi:hypothetical protein